MNEVFGSGVGWCDIFYRMEDGIMGQILHGSATTTGQAD
jgi:hypothetical protein